MKKLRQPGKLVSLRRRDWVVLPSQDPELLIIKPLGGSDDETTGIYLPIKIDEDLPKDAFFPKPTGEDLGDINTAKLLHEAARLAFRNGAGPFRAMAKLSFRPRAYQIVPLVMALKLEVIRLLIADDVGVGKTIEALLIVKEMLERRKIKRFAVLCLPHLCDQWQEEFRSKIGIEAVIIRSNTQARLDRKIQGDTSVYDFYPYQIISIDYIKNDTRRDQFVKQCPEMIIVDEVHSCSRPAGASKGQQQRHALLGKIASIPDKHLIMLTATPHSGKSEEFHSLLGMIDPEFETLDLPKSTQQQRKTLAKYFVQRKRADVEKWMGEDTSFPKRDAIEWDYDLSKEYESFFYDIVDFAKNLVSTDSRGGQKRMQYWTALGLLRGVMSSPRAGEKMLTTRMQKLDVQEKDIDAFEDNDNPVADLDSGYESDHTPTQLIEQRNWSDYQQRKLRGFAKQIKELAGFDYDNKLYAASIMLEDWIEKGFKPVVFCRYIETANYLGEHLKPFLSKKIHDLNVEVITSELPDDLRKQHISEMGKSKYRILIATDCLSEGINLQDHFTAVLHYDLPWNPNRLEQREGRVDRFGQQAKEVKACLLYGKNNPIDSNVLDVLLRKVREIKKATGINVPFPENSQSIIDAIANALLINPNRQIQRKLAPQQPTLFDNNEIDIVKGNVSRRLEEAAEREKVSHGIFAQNAIKANEIEQDLKSVDEAIGDPNAVMEFVIQTLQNLLGVEIHRKKEACYSIVTANIPPQIRELLPEGSIVKVSFKSPTPEGYYYLGRNHPFVAQLCQLIMANTISKQGKRAARASVIRSKQVSIKTTLLLFRCRNVIEQSKAAHQIVAEEMFLWGWKGTPNNRKFLDQEEAKKLLKEVSPSSNLSREARKHFLENELGLLSGLEDEIKLLAENQSKQLVAAHERFSSLINKHKFQVVYPVLPMDLMGIYVILPEVTK